MILNDTSDTSFT